MTFCHNQICGLAVGFKKYFLVGLHVLPKTNPQDEKGPFFALGVASHKNRATHGA